MPSSQIKTDKEVQSTDIHIGEIFPLLYVIFNNNRCTVYLK